MRNPTSTAAIVNRDRWNRLARCIMARWGSVQRRGWVSVRMPSHSQKVGRWRFSGLAFQRPTVPPAASSAPPSPCLPLLAGQPVSQRVNQIVVRELVVFCPLGCRSDRLILASEPSGSVGVIRRSSGSRMWIKSSKSLGRFA